MIFYKNNSINVSFITVINPQQESLLCCHCACVKASEIRLKLNQTNPPPLHFDSFSSQRQQDFKKHVNQNEMFCSLGRNPKSTREVIIAPYNMYRKIILSEHYLNSGDFKRRQNNEAE